MDWDKYWQQRAPRSAAYRAGFQAGYEWRSGTALPGTAPTPNWPAGMSAHDAWLSGWEHGKQLAQQQQEQGHD